MRLEPLAYLLLNGLPNLTFEAWHELEHEHKNLPYGPDWEAYQKSENEGGLRFIALREDGNLIGYAAIILDVDFHHSGVILGIYRDIYVAKGKRGHAAQFVRFIEKQLSLLGVNRVLLGERLTSENGSGQFYRAMGYEPQELIHGKTLNKGTRHETFH